MKTYIGLFILVIVLVTASGCTTQQAIPPATVTATATETAGTEVPTQINTPEPTVLPTEVSTTVPNVTATALATPRPSNTWSTKYLTIHIRNNTYVPSELTILPGAGVTWINDDAVVHIVKATGESAGKFTSSEMVSSATFHYTFGEATGSFEFGDPKYPGMKGTIIVREGDSVVGASPAISPGSS